MEQETEAYGRRSIRLKDHDYTQVGAYFVTITTQGRLALFGEVVGGAVRLNDAGEMIREGWLAMPQRFPFVDMDAFVVMPDHVHGIVVVRGGAAPTPASDSHPVGRPGVGASLVGAQGSSVNPVIPRAHALGDVIGAYKSLTTLTYAREVHTARWTPFHVRLWQRNFYERIIRDEHEMNEFRAYIRDNPSRWEPDGLM